LQCAEFLNEQFGVVDPGLGFRCSGLWPSTEPFDFTADPVLQAVAVLGLGGAKLFALEQKLAIAAAHPEEPVRINAVDLGHVCCEVLEKVTIVADYDTCEPGVHQEPFEPHDRLDVEMIGRLIEQQNIGIEKQLARNRETLSPAAR
jgi:hypothetical protein